MFKQAALAGVLLLIPLVTTCNTNGSDCDRELLTVTKGATLGGPLGSPPTPGVDRSSYLATPVDASGDCVEFNLWFDDGAEGKELPPDMDLRQAFQIDGIGHFVPPAPERDAGTKAGRRVLFEAYDRSKRTHTYSVVLNLSPTAQRTVRVKAVIKYQHALADSADSDN